MSEMSSQKTNVTLLRNTIGIEKLQNSKSATQRTTLLEIGDFLCTI